MRAGEISCLTARQRMEQGEERIGQATETAFSNTRCVRSPFPFWEIFSLARLKRLSPWPVQCAPLLAPFSAVQSGMIFRPQERSVSSVPLPAHAHCPPSCVHPIAFCLLRVTCAPGLFDPDQVGARMLSAAVRRPLTTVRVHAPQNHTPGTRPPRWEVRSRRAPCPALN